MAMGAARATVLLAFLVVWWRASAGPTLAKRRPLKSHTPLTAKQYEALADGLPHKDFKVIVKFHDSARFRINRGGTGGLADGAPAFASALKGCATQVAAVSKQLGLATSIRPLFGSMAGGLEALLKRAEERSGREQPDLHGMVEISVQGNNATKLLEIQSAFDRIACTEYTSVHLGPPPMPHVVRQTPTCLPACAPGQKCSFPTGNCTPFYFKDCNRNLHEYSERPDFYSMQRYRGAHFVDVDYANSQGALGQGVTIADTENAFASHHEALPQSIVQNPPFVQYPWADMSHGTAVQSILVGNEKLPGIAPKATSSFWSNYAGYSQSHVIVAAGATLKVGDVMLYEAAWQVPESCPCAGGTWAADILVEVKPDIFTATKTLTDAGIIVVEAAGNGAVDLDLSYNECPCLGYNLTEWKSWGDSGAIVVGAGTSDEQRAKMSFSTYGERVDAQAWGENVMAADYTSSSSCGACWGLKDFSIPGHEEDVIQMCDFSTTVDKNMTYQGGFDGTSSASAVAAGAVAALQSYNTAVLGRPVLLPEEMRQLLVETGAPQGGPDAAETPIGPLIQLRPAMELLASGGGDGAPGGASNASLLGGRVEAVPVARHQPGAAPPAAREEVDVGSFLQEPAAAQPAGRAGEL